jgi:transcriptional regulator GlxA family with amidase domain
MKTILVLALDGVMDSSLGITIDTVRAAQFLSRSGKGGAVRLLTAGFRKTVTTGSGMRMDVDCRFADVTSGEVKPDWIVIPGLGLASDEAIRNRLAKADAKAAVELLCHATRTTRIGASCSAVFLLARTGLLAGRTATSTWWLAQLFRAHYPEVKLDETRMLVRDGQFYTAGAAYAQLDLILAVIADLMGNAAAETCSRYLLMDQRPSQARYMAQSHTQHVDPTVVAAERWIDAHLSNPISVAQIADALALSPKTLSRRFDAAMGLTPLKFVQRRRLMQAAHLLESTALPIEAVAAQVGYQDGTALRKLIKREFGVTPGAMRADVRSI